jgi:hypothetical protein
MLNYSYAIPETEATIACHLQGLDPSLGLMHTDLRYRGSLATDVMEPARPVVDAVVLDLLESRELECGDIHSWGDGSSRLLKLASRARFSVRLLPLLAPRWASARWHPFLAHRSRDRGRCPTDSDRSNAAARSKPPVGNNLRRRSESCYRPGPRYDTDFRAASSASWGVSSTVVLVVTSPLAPTVMLTAAAVALSGRSRMVTTSSSPKAK